jgi:dihydroflavonol-4-reductase
MKKILVTGATGLIGSQICVQLLQKGDVPRTLARNADSNDAKALKKLGVEVIAGDVSDFAGVQKAAEGMEGIIHSAAMLGRPGSSIVEGFPSNVMGSLNVFTAAKNLGGIPVLQLTTSTFYDMWDKPLNERSPIDQFMRNVDPYSITKRLGYVEGVVRAAEGQDIRFMLPGGAFGISPCLENAMINPSFNARIALAIRGEMAEQLPLPVPWVFADDCAYVCIAALERGSKGERYLAMGRAEDVDTIPNVCNKACEMAGVKHRVRGVPKEQLDDPNLAKRFAPTVISLAKRTYPKPFFDSSYTEKQLGYKPTKLEDALRTTIDWMRREKII